jgi:hypothetical protein
MYKALDFNLKKIDKFHHVPLLGFQGKAKQASLLGGCSTILIFIIVLYVFVYEMYLMVIFSDYYHR